MNFDKIIDEIADNDKPIVNMHLADLSQMTTTDLSALKKRWGSISVERRRQIIHRLAESARDNVELNFDLLFRFCLSDEDEDIRAMAIDGLWENDNPAFIKTFVSMMENDESEKVQASAAAALGKFALWVECGEIREEYGPVLSRALLGTIENTGASVDVRRRALEAVSPMSLPSVKEAIRKAYQDRDERLKISAIYAMGKTCDESWLPTILKEMNSADAEIRFEAAGACGEIGAPECVPHLLEHLHDPDIEVRLAVIHALGDIGGREAKRGLERIARDTNEAIRDAVEQALSVIETTEDMTLFEMDMPDEHDNRRN